MQYFFLINISYLKVNNPDSFITINKILNKHNYTLNHDMIEFENTKNLPIQ